MISKDTAEGNTSDTISIIVDFGTTDCEGNDGSYRKGMILITSIINNNSGIRTTRRIQTNNYSVDGNIISIVRKLEYGGLDAQNNHKWDLTMQGRIDFSDGRNIEQIRTWIEGINTPQDWKDDVFTIQGSSTGTRIDGKNISTTITNTLIVKTICPYISSGSIKIETESRPNLDIDYGDGTYDNKASCTSQNQTWIITL
jgi:hypothetical protein